MSESINIVVPNLSDVPEIKPVMEGEYDLRITGVQTKMTNGDPAKGKLPRPMINLTIEVIGEPNADIIFHSLFMPIESDQERTKTKMLGDIKVWAEACSLPLDGLNVHDFMNSEIRAYVIQDEWNGQVRNQIKTLV